MSTRFPTGVYRCLAIGWLAWGTFLSTGLSQAVDPFAPEEVPLRSPGNAPVSPGRISIQDKAPLETEKMATFSPNGTNTKTGLTTPFLETTSPAAPLSLKGSNESSQPAPLKPPASFPIALAGLIAVAIFACLALFAFLQRSPRPD